jgi:hypothetical protein
MSDFDKITVSEALEIARQIRGHARAAYDLFHKELDYKAEIQAMPFEVFHEVFSLGFIMASRLIDMASKNS